MTLQLRQNAIEFRSSRLEDQGLTRSIASKKKPRVPRQRATRTSSRRSSNRRRPDQVDALNTNASIATSGRHVLGVSRNSAAFPVRPARSDLPDDYSDVLVTIKARIRQERLRAVVTANAAMVLLYWDVGHMILERQQHSGWGARIIDRLAADLRDAYPDMKGFSPRNLKYMRAFSAAWPDRAIVQGPLAQISWYHNIALLEKVSTEADRLWYARLAIEHGWSQPILILQIEGRAHQRHGKAVSNFKSTLPPTESDMAARIFKDPYLFDFLGTADPRRERDVEQALVDHIQRFLLELGTGFAFVGRQVLLEVGDPSALVRGMAFAKP
jgi:predicted nuclease of restriction endonuclease-like (RecB) superfamily